MKFFDYLKHIKKLNQTSLNDFEVKDIDWHIEESSKDSILFVDRNPYNIENVDKYLEKSTFGALVVFGSINGLEKYANVVEVSGDDYSHLQKICSDHLYPIDINSTFLGVTGTNGKTSITGIVSDILLDQGKSTLLIGTLGIFKNNKQVLDLGFTTPPFVELRKILYNYGTDVDFVIMELSSHGLDQERAFQVSFNNVAWTNFTQDHLDYHQDMDHYFGAKMKVFSNHLVKDGHCFFPPTQKELFERVKDDRKIMIKESDFPELPEKFSKGFLKDNLLLSLALVKKYIEINKVNFKNVKVPQGRFEEIKIGKKIYILDFAHTPDAIENICMQAKNVYSKKLIIVFGCGGNRDKKKRPEMLAKALSYCDKVIVTSDNPRRENPMDIINDIIAENKDNSKIIIEEDRKKAIFLSNQISSNNDIVIVAGKGHENYIEINDVKHPYSDREVILSLVNSNGT